MPEFVNPFSGLVSREMTHTELVRAIMLDIAAELEAVHLYLAHMDATSNEDARKVLYDIALEELVHAGEFTSLLYRLDPISGEKAKEGFDEVAELLKSKAPLEVSPTSGNAEEESQGEQVAAPQGLTVGDLIGQNPNT
ncbi:MAG TPA: hypothetical protein PLU88_00225 [Armatimonadota bacterium]|nr:hypothetical protein [Armatimonadota bacterium]HOM70691.1 hypothetical protein [Armatimonadota bacterium]HPP73539.1 hypothetical protein [Armatimonadota bacterium]